MIAHVTLTSRLDRSRASAAFVRLLASSCCMRSCCLFFRITRLSYADSSTRFLKC
jgi:hypothetical protein